MMPDLHAIETSGIVIDARHIETSGLVPVGKRVRLVIFWPEKPEHTGTGADWLRAAAVNSAFDFWSHPDEDIYSLADGKPIEREK